MTETLVEGTHASTTQSTAPRAGVRWPTRMPRALPRYVGVGAVANAVHALVFLALGAATGAGSQSLHLVATGASTVVANELHRTVSFSASERGSRLRVQTTGGIGAALGWLASSAALAVWTRTEPGAATGWSLVVVYSVGAAVGLVNFHVLRRVTAGLTCDRGHSRRRSADSASGAA